MEKLSTMFGSALKKGQLRPIDYCRAVTKLTGHNYSPVMTSRWLQGVHEPPAPAVALAILLGQIPEEERATLIQAPPRKKFTRKEAGKAAS